MSTPPRKHMNFKRMLTSTGTIWKTEQRDALITNSKGGVVFEQKDLTFPVGWSQMAVNIVASKYFFGPLDSPIRENSLFSLVNRVVNKIQYWGEEAGYFSGFHKRNDSDSRIFADELRYLLIGQFVSFNSPVWFNLGVDSISPDSQASNWHWHYGTKKIAKEATGYSRPQCSACFINKAEDSMESILELNKTEGMLFKFGSGAGVNLSPLRSSSEQLAGGGVASGPLSFMRGFDAFAGVIKSGGTTRRAAKMVVLNTRHPDIEEFIACKGKEEAKAHALMAQGYDGTSGPESEAYLSISFQNANNSVRADDEFMKVATLPDGTSADYELLAVKDGRVVKTVSAKEMLRSVALQTWKCGDPGMQFDTTINHWHTCPALERINASNPCSEYMFLDNSACNLASFNLLKFFKNGVFNLALFRHAVRILTVAMDIIVDGAGYPTEQIAKNSHDYRPLGLGYANLGALLMEMGLAYDSDKGRDIAALITSVMGGQAYATSSEMAEKLLPVLPANESLKGKTPLNGAFPGYEINDGAFMRVMRQHQDAAYAHAKVTAFVGSELAFASRAVWDEVVTNGNKYGFRNAQSTVLAPTGTIGFMMDCDTTGIEPMMALITYKKMVGGGFTQLAYPVVKRTLLTLGYEKSCVMEILEHIAKTGTVVGSCIDDVHVPIFDCALSPAGGGRSINWLGHVKMMEVTQPFLSGAISKTVNMPSDSTVDDIFNAYVESWKRGLKAVAIYRDGSKGNQVMVTSKDKDKKPEIATPASLKEVLSKATIQEIAAALWNSDRALTGDQDGNLILPSKLGWIVAAEILDTEIEFITPDLKAPPVAVRHKLADTRDAKVHKFAIAGHKGYLHVGLYPNGEVGEIFITMAKEGSTLSGVMDAFATSISIGLQHGVPLTTLVDKFEHTRFEPSGWSGNPDIGFAKSITDYIFRWLKINFVDAPALKVEAVRTTISEVFGTLGGPEISGTVTGRYKADGTGPYIAGTDILRDLGAEAHGCGLKGAPQATSASKSNTAVMDFGDAPSCSNCGAITVRSGSCYACLSCGGTSGCS